MPQMASCYGLMVSDPYNSYVEVLTPSVTVFGDEASKGVIRVN